MNDIIKIFCIYIIVIYSVYIKADNVYTIDYEPSEKVQIIPVPTVDPIFHGGTYNFDGNECRAMQVSENGDVVQMGGLVIDVCSLKAIDFPIKKVGLKNFLITPDGFKEIAKDYLYNWNDNGNDLIPIASWSNGSYITLNNQLYEGANQEIEYDGNIFGNIITRSGANQEVAVKYPLQYSYALLFVIKAMECIIEQEGNPFIFKSRPYPDTEITIRFEGMSHMFVTYDIENKGTFSEAYSIIGDFGHQEVEKLLDSDLPERLDSSLNEDNMRFSSLVGNRIYYWSANDTPLEFMVIDNILYSNQVKFPTIKDFKFIFEDGQTTYRYKDKKGKLLDSYKGKTKNDGSTHESIGSGDPYERPLMPY